MVVTLLAQRLERHCLFTGASGARGKRQGGVEETVEGWAEDGSFFGCECPDVGFDDVE